MNGRVAGFARRHPLFCAALVVVVCVGFGAARPVLGQVLALLAGVAGAWWVDRRHGWAWWACGALGVTLMGVRGAAQAKGERALAGRVVERVEVLLLQDGAGDLGYWEAPGRLLSGPHAGVRVQWRGRGEAPVAGAVVTAAGRFDPLPVPRNPGEFDTGEWLRNQGVAAVFRAEGAAASVSVGRRARWTAALRHGFRDSVAAGLPEDSQAARVIRAVVIGEHPADSDELVAAFRNSGTLHVFCVSGLHVGLVGGIGWLLLTGCGVSRLRSVPVVLAAMFGYAWLTGNGPPAVRAAWMAAVFLGAFVFRRRPDALNSLGAVLLATLLWDGRLLFQTGVQLSYGVVAAIIIGASAGGRWFGWISRREIYLPDSEMSRRQRNWLRFRQSLAGSLGVSTVAFAGSMPLTIVHFGLVTPVSIIATVVLVPLVFTILLLGIFSAVLHPLAAPLARGINRVNAVVAEACAWTAGRFAVVPGGHFEVRRVHQPFLLIYDLEYGAGAACFSAGRDGAVLLDCGDRHSFRWKVLPSLRRVGALPDAVVLSHPDGGHLGGGAPVWQSLPVKQALLPVQRSRSPAFRAWHDEAPAAGVRTLPARAGQVLDLPDGAWLEVIHAPDPLAINAIADERVAVHRLHWRGWRLLFLSDSGYWTEDKILKARTDVRADVIIAGRHRRDLTLGDAFLDAVNPQVIIASNSRFPPEERLPDRQTRYWRSRGIHVLDQGQTGGVTLRIHPSGALEFSGFADRSLLRLKPR